MRLTGQLAQYASTGAATPHGVVHFRRAASPGRAGAVTHVLLHGIGSASASWLAQLQQARQTRAPASHVLAWDAPGYGDSEGLPMDAPVAADYATRLWSWLDALGAQTDAPFTLAGHSLGALIAAAALRQRPARIGRLVLLAPAQGHARADAALREHKLSERLSSLAQLGPAGLARKRAAAMLSPQAGPELVAFVEQVMAGIRPRGYAQAARMLAGADLAADLAAPGCPAVVASGSADTITPMAACRALAQQVGASYVSLGAVGHSCALEAADRVNALLGIAGETP